MRRFMMAWWALQQERAEARLYGAQDVDAAEARLMRACVQWVCPGGPGLLWFVSKRVPPRS